LNFLGSRPKGKKKKERKRGGDGRQEPATVALVLTLSCPASLCLSSDYKEKKKKE